MSSFSLLPTSLDFVGSAPYYQAVIRQNALKTSNPNKPNGLAILDDPVSLRDESPFLDRLSWTEQPRTTQPRALRSLAQIVDGGLCHRCGSCVGICPTNVLGLDNQEYPLIERLSACTDCDLCVKVCPGDEFDYQGHHERLLGTKGSLTDTHGTFSEAILAYSTDEVLRERSTSGGLITALLLGMLDRGAIDGAVVIASDPKMLWKGMPVIARTREEILAATKSKYAISPTNSVFKEIINVPGRYALVGLPCQIHGYVKAAALDERLRERIVLTIGLFCHAAIEHEAFEVIWKTLGEKRERAKKFVSRVGKHPGAPHVEFDDGTQYPVYFGDRKGYRPSSMEVINILYRLYTPKRCLTCFDGLAEFADIAVGDPWMPPPDDDVDFYKGYSFGLVRTPRGAQVVSDLTTEGAIVTKSLTTREALQCNKMMVTEKRWRAFRVIETHRRQGKPIPSYGTYGFSLPQHSGKQFLETEIHMLTHIFCFLPTVRGAFLRFMLGSGGYYLFWLNSKRRALRLWTRDSVARLRRRLYGRR